MNTPCLGGFRTIGLIVLSFVTVLPAYSTSVGKASDFAQGRLQNGLEYVVVQRVDQPLSYVLRVIRAGSMHEEPGYTSTAHMLEHLHFGRPHPSEPAFFTAAKALGVRSNAGTRLDSTWFKNTLGAGELRSFLELDASHLQRFRVTDEAVESEKASQRNEFASKYPRHALFNMWRFWYQTAYRGTSLGWHTAGNIDDLNRVSGASVRRYFRNYYRPDRSLVLVISPESVAHVSKLLHSLYGSWKAAKDSKPKKVTVKQPRKGMSARQALQQSPLLVVGFPSVRLDRSNWCSAVLADHILFQSDSSVLRQRLVEREELAVDVQSLNFGRDYGSIKGSIALKNASGRGAVEIQLWQVIGAMKGITQRDLDHAYRSYRWQRELDAYSATEIGEAIGQGWLRGLDIEAVWRSRLLCSAPSLAQFKLFWQQTIRKENAVLVRNF